MGEVERLLVLTIEFYIYFNCNILRHFSFGIKRMGIKVRLPHPKN